MGAGESCLADQLYDAVNSQLHEEEKNLSGKITGMLLETDDSITQQLLDKPSLLHSAIQKARASIQSTNTCIHKDSKTVESNEVLMVQDDANENDYDELGQSLYDKIYEVYPKSAAKLTGMLLELDQTRLKRILESESLFKSATDKALRVLMDKNEENNSLQANYNNDCRDKYTEVIEESLFRKVEELYPDNASKITGMLLELDIETLIRLLHDDAMFKEAVRKATETINSTEDPS